MGIINLIRLPSFRRLNPYITPPYLISCASIGRHPPSFLLLLHSHILYFLLPPHSTYTFSHMAQHISTGSSAAEPDSSSLAQQFQSLYGIVSDETLVGPQIKPFIQGLKVVLDLLQPYMPALESAGREGRSPPECATIRRHFGEAKSLVLALKAGKDISDSAERLRIATTNMKELLPQVRHIAALMQNGPDLSISAMEREWSMSRDRNISMETIREDESYSRVDRRTGETVHGHRIRTSYNMTDRESERSSMVMTVLKWGGIGVAATLLAGAATLLAGGSEGEEEEEEEEEEEN
ncbi:hypothetical protein KP509_11G053800 [Ceratopteris richardii]|uniref:Uncharacterized protein n=1 Tax=Ceratopteris richardii TaxID=49495 RepID=A0A8T2TVM6_CERRI|nr:hypothetical protein KP509_11G053800 [Ceratopteris richardii]